MQQFKHMLSKSQNSLCPKSLQSILVFNKNYHNKAKGNNTQNNGFSIIYSSIDISTINKLVFNYFCNLSTSPTRMILLHLHSQQAKERKLPVIMYGY